MKLLNLSQRNKTDKDSKGYLLTLSTYIWDFFSIFLP